MPGCVQRGQQRAVTRSASRILIFNFDGRSRPPCPVASVCRCPATPRCGPASTSMTPGHDPNSVSDQGHSDGRRRRGSGGRDAPCRATVYQRAQGVRHVRRHSGRRPKEGMPMPRHSLNTTSLIEAQAGKADRTTHTASAARASSTERRQPRGRGSVAAVAARPFRGLGRSPSSGVRIGAPAPVKVPAGPACAAAPCPRQAEL